MLAYASRGRLFELLFCMVYNNRASRNNRSVYAIVLRRLAPQSARQAKRYYAFAIRFFNAKQYAWRVVYDDTLRAVSVWISSCGDTFELCARINGGLGVVLPLVS